MAIVVINENTKEGRELIEFLRDKSYARIVEEEGECPAILSEPFVAYKRAPATSHPNENDSEPNIPFECIPGLPYTHEERIESLRRAEEEPSSWLMSHDDFKKEMDTW